MTYVLWLIQVLLALLFLFAGGTKLVLPIEVLASVGLPYQIAPAGWVVGVIVLLVGAEVVGALGRILPGRLRIKPWRTPLAAVGLVVIMIGATPLNIVADGVAARVVPLVTGLLGAFVAYGRWRLAPHPARREMIRRRSS